MGIKGFHPFLKKKLPGVYRQVHLSNYGGKRVAVDISGFYYKFNIINKDKWIDLFAYLVFALRKNQLHPIFIYDGEAPPEKTEEKSRRSSQKVKMGDNVMNLRFALDKFYDSGECDEILHQEMKKLVLKDRKEGKKPPSLGIEEKVEVDIPALERRYKQLEAQIVHFNENDLLILNDLFTLCGIQFIRAPGEAEAYCASLYHQGKVDLVMSNDSDVCAYKVGKFLYDVDVMRETVTEIDFQEITKGLNMTGDQFLDFCILLGTDFNDNIPGVGPVNAFKLITEKKSIEEIGKSKDISCLNHVRIREIFNTRWDHPGEILSNNHADVVKINNFLRLKNCRVKFETIERAFKPREIIFDFEE